jgi:hypothetical protein
MREQAMSAEREIRADYDANSMMATLLRTGKETRTRALLPPERVYPLSNELKQRLGASQ